MTQTKTKEGSTPVTNQSIKEITKPKKKKKYTRKWKNIQRVEMGCSKSAKRLSDSVSDGVKIWIKKRDLSAGKKKDGALKDLNKNVTKAFRKTLCKASEAPADVFDALSKCNVGKTMKIGKRIFR
jgi:hypothetical protein